MSTIVSRLNGKLSSDVFEMRPYRSNFLNDRRFRGNDASRRGSVIDARRIERKSGSSRNTSLRPSFVDVDVDVDSVSHRDRNGNFMQIINGSIPASTTPPRWLHRVHPTSRRRFTFAFHAFTDSSLRWPTLRSLGDGKRRPTTTTTMMTTTAMATSTLPYYPRFVLSLSWSLLLPAPVHHSVAPFFVYFC